MKLRWAQLGAGLVGFSILLAGCRTADRTMERVALAPAPAAFGGQAEAEVPVVAMEQSAWEAVLAEEMLVSLIKDSLLENRDLRQMAARVIAAQAEAQIQGWDRWPSLGVGGTGSRRRLNQIGGGIVVGSVTVSNFDAGLSSSWELDLWGRLADARQAAEADSAAVTGDYLAARLSLIGQVVKLYYALTERSEQLALANRRMVSFESNQKLVETQFDRGLTEALDLRLIRSQTALARVAVVEQQQALESSERQLEVLLGRYPAKTLERPARLPEPGPPLEAGLPSALLERRPDLRAARARLAAAALRSSAADKLRFPQLSLTAAGGSSSSELENLLDSGFRVWSLVGNLSQPLFQGGRISGGRLRAEALWEQATAAYEKSVLEAFREIEDGLAAEQSLRQRLEHQRVVAEESAAAEALAWERYERGLLGVATVLEAQRRSYEAQSTLIGVRGALLRNRIDLLVALGGNPEPVLGVAPAQTTAVLRTKSLKEDQ